MSIRLCHPYPCLQKDAATQRQSVRVLEAMDSTFSSTQLAHVDHGKVEYLTCTLMADLAHLSVCIY